MKKTIRPIALPKTLLIALLAICMSIMSARAYAKEPIITPEGLQKVKVVTISDKAEKYNLIFVGEQRFRVSPSAIILDYGGKSLPLRFLIVPCKAKITYRLFGYNRDPLIEKIQLK